ncbi:MAG TPA: peptide ABC transporter substrate-binding protein [Firmicutes bacterium]|nr:peptide ABC transporter substrate-binding protein [Bacillota bacterium]
MLKTMKKIMLVILGGSVVFPSLVIEATDITQRDYQYVYGMDPQTFDYLYTYKHTDTQHLANFVDGLLEHDEYGNLIPSIASHYESNEDYTVWTFKIRENVNWYTDDGVEYAPVTAHDFVAGLQHAVDFDSQTLYLVEPLIKNLTAYKNKEVTFDEVGIKALDDHTLQYTLNAPTPYFHTMTTYAILFPVNQTFLESKGVGCKLGAPDLSACEFGALKSDAILYNGAYLLKNLTPKSVIEYEMNPNYWDVEHVYIPKVRLLFFGEGDPSSMFTMFDQGDLASAPVYANNPGMFKAAKDKYGDSIFVTDNGRASFFATFVFDRNIYHSPIDSKVDVSSKTEKQKEDTKKAIWNKEFRQAIMFALDTSAINAQEVGHDLKYLSLRNMLSQPDFVYNSKGESFGELVAKNLTTLNPQLYPSGIDLSDGAMAYYNVETAQKRMAVAKEKLLDEGVDFPVQLDLIVNGEVDMSFRSAQAIKSTLEYNLKGDVQVNLIISDTENMVAMQSADQVNTDLYFASAWSPDYGDPKTYLDTLDPDCGDLLKSFGLNYTGSEVGEDAIIKKRIGLYEYKALKEAADSEYYDLDKRYERYAKTEAYAIDQAYLIPYTTSGGSYAVTKVVPYTRIYSPYGLSPAKFKRMQISDQVITVKEREGLKATWEQRVSEFMGK